MPSPLKLLAWTALAVAASLAAVAHPPPAAAAAPCWKTLLNDWYDGRIDGTYPVHCYQEALHHLPADVQTYSSAHDDILRALQSALAKDRRSGHAAGPNTLVPPTIGKKKVHGKIVVAPGRKPNKGLSGLADKLNPSSASSLPVPLLVLGGLAILLVAAGGAGLVVKQIQGRKHAP